MRIRRRLTLYGALVAGLTMLAFGLLLSILARGSVPAEQDKTLAEIANELVARSPNLDTTLVTSDKPLTTSLESSTDPFTAVYRQDGTAIYTTGTVGGAAPVIPAAVLLEAAAKGVSVATAQLTGGLEVRLHARVWPTTDSDGAVLVVGQSTAFLEEQLGGLTAVIWVAAVLAMIAALLVSFLVSGRALRPLRELAATTDEIARTGDLSRRLPKSDAADEVGALTASFNSMLHELETARRRMSDSLAGQRRFVADASHELRSPLTTIRSNAGFLRERPDAAEEDRREAIADISAESDRMARLVENLLTLAVADARPELAAVPVDLSQVLRDLAQRATTLHLPVVWMDSGSAVVECDRDAVTRLVWILIDNSATHGAGEITVSLVEHPGHVSIVVADDGPGFLPGDLDRIFERFYRGDAARSPAGAGLGLAIATTIIEAHGGEISAANGSDGGAVVSVTFPKA